MADDIWKVATWEGNRRKQHEEYYALTFAEKLIRLEELAEVSDWIGEKARIIRQRSGPTA